MYRTLFIVLLCAYGAFSNNCKGDRHNAKFGERQENDKLVYMENLEIDSELFQKVKRTFQYPPCQNDDQESTSTKIISHIEIIDQFTNGNGGCAKLESGGPGTSSVRIKLTSKRSHGLHFIIKVFTNDKLTD